MSWDPWKQIAFAAAEKTVAEGADSDVNLLSHAACRRISTSLAKRKIARDKCDAPTDHQLELFIRWAVSENVGYGGDAGQDYT